MKKYQSGGRVDDKIPQEAQNILQDRKEKKGREAFVAAQREENEAPKKFVKEKFQSLKDMLGIKNTPVVKKAKGGKVSSASKRADGCATRGKTRGRLA